MSFHPGQKIMAFQGGHDYKAKVLDVRSENGVTELLVHYQGWNKKWDEWISLDRAGTEGTPSAASVAARTTAKPPKATKGSKSKKGKGKKKKKASASVKKSGAAAVPASPSAGKASQPSQTREEGQVKDARFLPIASTLKKVLVDDWQFVTQQSKLVVLPCEYPVSRILSMFVEEQGGKAGEDTDELQVWQEVAAGVQSYFERSLGTILLYRTERRQYQQLIDSPAPSDESQRGRKRKRGEDAGVDNSSATAGRVEVADMYGATHLLRLFVKLPELLQKTFLTPEERRLLSKRLRTLLAFVGARQRGAASTLIRS